MANTLHLAIVSIDASAPASQQEVTAFWGLTQTIQGTVSYDSKDPMRDAALKLVCGGGQPADTPEMRKLLKLKGYDQ